MTLSCQFTALISDVIPARLSMRMRLFVRAGGAVGMMNLAVELARTRTTYARRPEAHSLRSLAAGLAHQGADHQTSMKPERDRMAVRTC